MDERCRVVKAQERKRPKSGVHNVLFSSKASSPPLGAPRAPGGFAYLPREKKGEKREKRIRRGEDEASGGPPGAPGGGLLAALERRDEGRGESWLAACYRVGDGRVGVAWWPREQGQALRRLGEGGGGMGARCAARRSGEGGL
jgi:hypothetical protein